MYIDNDLGLCIDVINMLVEPVCNVFNWISWAFHTDFSEAFRQAAANILP